MRMYFLNKIHLFNSWFSNFKVYDNLLYVISRYVGDFAYYLI